ncbi:flagellar P-ring protein FlgI-like protein [Bordetella bronchiseptica B18-5 (C3)]|nr:flagellar P-ring protein FlgI-like protein [Bordetella bronchiseptica B18-5 (C3)]
MIFPTSLSVLLIPLARAVLALALLGAGAAHAERLKDLASIQGVRGNQLIGYGLVVGLDGSGDQVRQTPFTQQSLTNMLSQLGITVPQGSNMQLKNVAAVMVTATLPSFARPGQTVDVVVSSMGNAKSLRGVPAREVSGRDVESVVDVEFDLNDRYSVLICYL